ncbi:MAG: hypothetical protein CML99_06485 [Rhodobiaceae bacterium]|nr:hypothetical protein [Rhodobiaceae bacterium]
MDVFMDGIQQQREHFETQAEQYLKARESPRHIYLKNEMWRALLSDDLVASLPQDRPIRMLEPMCGACDGRMIIEDQLGYQVDYAGFDYSPAMVATARGRFPEANIWEQDVTKFEADAQFDLIMLVGALHHVAEHAESVVAKLSASLAPGGIFVLSEPVHNNPVFRLVREAIYKRNDSFDFETERGFTTAELREIFTSAGMETVKEIYPSMLAYVLWGCPEAFPALDKGPMSLVRSYVALERLFWGSLPAKYLTFGMFSAYRKPL